MALDSGLRKLQREEKMKRIVLLLMVGLLVGLLPAPTAAAKAGKGLLFYDGETVRTVVPPAAMPKLGTDNFYAVMDGADGQLGIAATAPGDKDYRGGKWAFHSVTWNVDPYLLTSEAAVFAAETAGDVSVTRVPANDFKCPIQP